MVWVLILSFLPSSRVLFHDLIELFHDLIELFYYFIPGFEEEVQQQKLSVLILTMFGMQLWDIPYF